MHRQVSRRSYISLQNDNSLVWPQCLACGGILEPQIPLRRYFFFSSTGGPRQASSLSPLPHEPYFLLNEIQLLANKISTLVGRARLTGAKPALGSTRGIHRPKMRSYKKVHYVPNWPIPWQRQFSTSGASQHAISGRKQSSNRGQHSSILPDF